jgi:hypothetical protein
MKNIRNIILIVLFFLSIAAIVISFYIAIWCDLKSFTGNLFLTGLLTAFITWVALKAMDSE